MKVLITGIDGFTGEHLNKYLLNKGYKVFGTSLKNEKENIFKCDITKKDEIQRVINKIKPNYIIHLAAISFVGYENNNEFYNVNTIGTENLLMSIDSNVDKVLIVSSAAVYGNQSSEVLDESMCVNPNNHYGISKYSAEQITKNYFDKLPIIITRPFNYTGVGQKDIFLIPKIIKHYKEKKEVIELGNLDVIREFNSVEFVCEAYFRLLNCEYKSEIVNIASGRGVKLLDIISYMNEISKYEIKIKINKKFVRKNEIKKLVGSNKKLFDMVGKVEQENIKDLLLKIYRG
ncbi:MAG TPA: NAD-dependent epimerase/dehydratase family protein [Piscirickettsiaceae bacterium]|nr:NAD-dependent epimerase/dehydratase family protein [Piscirickettsiaceae bacterium]